MRNMNSMWRRAVGPALVLGLSFIACGDGDSAAQSPGHKLKFNSYGDPPYVHVYNGPRDAPIDREIEADYNHDETVDIVCQYLDGREVPSGPGELVREPTRLWFKIGARTTQFATQQYAYPVTNLGAIRLCGANDLKLKGN